MSAAMLPAASDLLRWEEMTDAEKLGVKAMSEASFEAMIRVWFQLIQGQYFIPNWHHKYECALAERVFRREVLRVIINVAPGSTKTEIWSVHWPVWCIIQCINLGLPSRWLPLSYSADLVDENATRIKEILDSEEFQTLWPLKLARDTQGKTNWKYYDQNGNEHRLYGTSIGGQVTGRRAGFMMPGFTGAAILDDPMPPRDAASKLLMWKGNLTVGRVVRSRLAHDGVPLVTIQQRVDFGDTTDYLMSDKTPDTYEIYRLPALINREYVDSLDAKTRADCINDTGFDEEAGDRVSYWPAKEPTETLLAMEAADPQMFAAQYQQNPEDYMDGGVIYAHQVEQVVKEGRYGHIPIEPALPAYTFWDLGRNDYMVLIVMQPFGKELRLVHCYHNRLQTMPHYINHLKDFQAEHNIRWGGHIGPHDLAVHELMGAQDRSRAQVAREMGLPITTMPRPKVKRDGYEALKRIFPRIWIDTNRCETLWKALKTLRLVWDPDQEAYKDQPVPKWATNFTDALEQMGLHYRDPAQQEPDEPPHRPGGWMGN